MGLFIGIIGIVASIALTLIVESVLSGRGGLSALSPRRLADGGIAPGIGGRRRRTEEEDELDDGDRPREGGPPGDEPEPDDGLIAPAAADAGGGPDGPVNGAPGNGRTEGTVKNGSVTNGSVTNGSPSIPRGARSSVSRPRCPTAGPTCSTARR